jgi:hypothetical protein
MKRKIQIALVTLTLVASTSVVWSNPGENHSPKTEEQAVPFHGTIQAIEIAEVQFPKLFVDGGGSGTATHLGHFTVVYEVEVDFLAHSTVGSSIFTAANGDNVFTDIIGSGTPTENPDVHTVVEVHTITGGTGRFEGATGSFIRTFSLNLVTGVSSGSFDGTLVVH